MTLSKLAKENKLIGVIGDFNIDLLNYDSNIFAGNILSSLTSDHLPQFAILNENAPDYKTSSYFAYDYKTFDDSLQIIKKWISPFW